MDFIRNQVLTFLCSTQTLSALSVIILIIAFQYCLLQLRRNSKLVTFAATLPGPFSLPFIGNKLDFHRAGNETMDWIMKCYEKYGSIFRIWIGKHLVVFLSDVADLEFVFRNPRTITKPALCQPFEDFWGDGLFASDIKIWKKTRKLQQSVYTNHVLPSYVPDLNYKIDGLVKSLKRLACGPEFDMIGPLSLVSLEIIAKTVLGVDINARDRKNLEFKACIREAFDIGVRKTFTPWLQIKLISHLLLGKKTATIRSKILDYTGQLMKDRVDELEETDGENVIPGISSESSMFNYFMLAAYRSQRVTGSKTIIRDEVASILTAGPDSVALTNAMCLLVIAAMPEIQDKLYDEIFEVFGDGDRPVDMNDLPRLPYLEQVVFETLRRYPLVSLLFKTNKEDFQIGERIFPGGTTIVIPVMAVHMNPKYYPNPQKFDPENFALDAIEKRPKLTFLSFGAGARNCVGKNYAILEVKLTLIALLRAFEFRTTLKLEELDLKIGINNRVASGYKMSLTLRDRRPSYMRERK